jgi:hypothetical protein
MVWPSASRAWELLDGVKGSPDIARPSLGNTAGGQHKRPAEDSTTKEESTVLQSGAGEKSGQNDPPLHGSYNVQGAGNGIATEMLGLDVRDAAPSASYLPYQEWWAPIRADGLPPAGQSSVMGPASFPSTLEFDRQPSVDDWMSNLVDSRSVYVFDPARHFEA